MRHVIRNGTGREILGQGHGRRLIALLLAAGIHAAEGQFPQLADSLAIVYADHRLCIESEAAGNGSR